ncbi:DUF1993 domain-containing protein [Hyphomonas johnsonii]|uniref:DUF1993 domain-containing protein n=1 Tax=Hyphomonas johnsonii MHS-2 TaxID=1280950 RepID=A0A059FV89_9PROT|nr:DUF1993 domain-containing protein [Hyphomonas johnsonii]KCZ94569.1 hypothetical protein HJO_04305 [Hyphomonas johnsonii MHS-2]
MNDTLSYVLKTSTNQMLGAMRANLKKAEAHARATDVEDAVFLAARLYPDMLPMGRQVQIACDNAARGAARLSGVDLPEFPDTETTFAELMARCDAALAFVNSTDDAKINASERETLQIPLGPQTVPMEGRQYLTSFVLANMFFHVSMAYGLLRHQGVVLGKRDFLVAS